MSTQGERQQFLWRPNDESSTTRTRYDLEADHWYRSFKAAEAKYQRKSFSESIYPLMLLLDLVYKIFIFLLLSLLNLSKLIRKIYN